MILYSIGCPKCKVLKAKLEEKGIEYIENDSKEEMRALGITEVPVLSDGVSLMDFKTAVEWINSQES